MATPAVKLISPTRLNRPQWLINQRDDLIWALGGAVIGYLALVSLALGANWSLFYLPMLLALEGPHVFATATRSYLDPNARQRLGLFLWLVVPLTLVGPVMVWAGFGQLFYLLAISWLHLHIAKQHVGFAMLYKRKAGEKEDYASDRYFLLASLLLPLALFWAHQYLATAAFRVLLPAAVVPYLILVAGYAGRQWRKYRAGCVALPKLYLMGLIVPLQWFAFAYAASSQHGIKAAGLIVAICHALQYHKLTWLYHQTESREASGQSRMWHRLGGYLFCVLILNLIFNVAPRVFAGSEIALAALWGIPFQHYLLDGKLWKTKEYPIFKRSLGLD